MGKSGGKRPLGTPGLRWEDNIKMDLKRPGMGGMEWIHLVQNRDRWLAPIQCGEFLD